MGLIWAVIGPVIEPAVATLIGTLAGTAIDCDWDGPVIGTVIPQQRLRYGVLISLQPDRERGSGAKTLQIDCEILPGCP